MPTIAEKMASSLTNAALTIGEMDADRSAFQSVLAKFIIAFEAESAADLENAYKDARKVLAERHI